MIISPKTDCGTDCATGVKHLRFASVCDGISAVGVAWKRLGWRFVFKSEIEPFPSAVADFHHPEAPNLGDMTNHNPQKSRSRWSALQSLRQFDGRAGNALDRGTDSTSRKFMNLMFQPQFEPLILSGRKPHTIRPKRKIPLRLGQTLSLRVWTGKPYRSPQREFAKAVVTRLDSFYLGKSWRVNKRRLSPDEANALAFRDGFADSRAMREWFEANHATRKFRGVLIHWKKL